MGPLAKARKRQQRQARRDAIVATTVSVSATVATPSIQFDVDHMPLRTRLKLLMSDEAEYTHLLARNISPDARDRLHQRRKQVRQRILRIQTQLKKRSKP